MTAIAPPAPAATNRVPDPSFENDAAAFPVVTNVTLFTGSWDTTTKFAGTRSFLVTRTSGTGNVIGTANLTPTAVGSAYRVLVTAGEVVSFSCRMMSDQTNWRARLDMVTRTAAGGTVSTQTGTLVSNLPPMAWQTITGSFTVPATGVYMYLVVNTFVVGSVVLGERAWHDALIVNTGATVEPYFDGSSPGCSWNGAPNASTSTRQAVYPWSLWDGSTAQPLTVSGVWTGTAGQPAVLSDISVA